MQNLGIAYMCLIITSCTFNNKQEKKTAEELSFFSVNNSDVKSETELPLSQLLESLEIIPLENKDEAFSKIGVIYISDNYIGCQPYDQSPYKLNL